jgi:hypothetical protein
MRTHAFHKHRCWCRGGMNPYGPTPSRVKSALFVNIMRSKKKITISCAVPLTSLTELGSSNVIWKRCFTRYRWRGDMTCRRKTRRQTVDRVMYCSVCWSQGDQQRRDIYLSDRLDAQSKQLCTSGGILSERQLSAWDGLGLLETVLQCG